MHGEPFEREASCSGEFDERTLKVAFPHTLFPFFQRFLGHSEMVSEIFGVIPQMIQHRHLRELNMTAIDAGRLDPFLATWRPFPACTVE